MYSNLSRNGEAEEGLGPRVSEVVTVQLVRLHMKYCVGDKSTTSGKPKPDTFGPVAQ